MEIILMKEHKLEELVKQLIAALPEGIKQTKQELEKNFRAVLQSAFNKMDLVTREEFDAQVNVLKRTREKVDAIEKKLKK